MKTALAPFLALLLFFAPPFCLSDQPGRTGEGSGSQRKDPILAGALSWYVPGLGQVYAGSTLKGAAFFVLEEALLIGTVLSFAEIKLDVTGSVGLGLNIKSKSNPDRGEQRAALVLGISLVAVHFINVIDAVNTTRKYNRALEPYLTVRTERGEEGSRYALSVNTPF